MSGSGDYISREAANEACREAVRRYPNSFYNGIEAARDAIRKLPAADVRPNVTGRWEYIECLVGRLLVNFPGCSECKATIMIPMESAKCSFNFCPNCGAMMEES